MVLVRVFDLPGARHRLRRRGRARAPPVVVAPLRVRHVRVGAGRRVEDARFRIRGLDRMDPGLFHEVQRVQEPERRQVAVAGQPRDLHRGRNLGARTSEGGRNRRGQDSVVFSLPSARLEAEGGNGLSPLLDRRAPRGTATWTRASSSRGATTCSSSAHPAGPSAGAGAASAARAPARPRARAGSAWFPGTAPRPRAPQGSPEERGQQRVGMRRGRRIQCRRCHPRA